MKFLKKLVDHQKENMSLLSVLNNRLAGYDEARSFKNIHASALMNETEFCPREVALLDITGILPKNKYISVPLRVTFDQGDSLHQMVRNDWLRDIAVGTWKCPHCGTKKPFQKVPKVACPSCGDKKWEYDEERFKSVSSGASGGIDFFVDIGAPTLSVVEIKTISKDDFKTLHAPLAEHRLRTNFYLWLIRDSDRLDKTHINVDTAKILYISKGYGAKDDAGSITPFKEFDVAYNPDSLIKYINKAKEVKLFRENKIIPVRICSTSFVGRVKKCACPKQCWSSQYDVKESK